MSGFKTPRGNRLILGGLLTVFSLASLLHPAEAARKYYPPGFTPPADMELTPAPTGHPEASTTLTPASTGASGGTTGTSVIIKTVPVAVKTSTPAKDPLLALMDEHRYYDAIRLVDTRLQKSPGNPHLLLTRAQILRQQGLYEEALSQAREILDRSQAERKHLNKAIKAASFNSLGWTYYRRALQTTHNHGKSQSEQDLTAASTAFRQALETAPNMANAWVGYARVALLMEDFKEAEARLSKAKKIAPKDPLAQLAQAELFLSRKQPDKAMDLLYKLKKSWTHEPEVYLLLAQASLETGKIDDAIIHLKQLLGFMPEHTVALKLLSQSYERKMKLQDAEQVLEKAVSLNPADEQSVEALLKIYGQRRESERSILLLKTLLKDKPAQITYGIHLLEHLNQEERWLEAYAEGLKLLPRFLENSENSLQPEQEKHLYRLTGLFSDAVYQKGRGILDPRILLSEPAIRQTREFLTQRLETQTDAWSPEAVQARRALLLLSPLVGSAAASAPVAQDFNPTPDILGLTLETTFLTGDWEDHRKLLQIAQTSENRLLIAHTLFRLGDYPGAKTLINSILSENPDLKDALSLKERVAKAESQREEQITALAMLPKKIAESYWEKSASEALRLGTGYGKTYSTIAKALVKRHRPELAYIHQLLAARYADNMKERQYWLQKANKTIRRVEPGFLNEF